MVSMTLAVGSSTLPVNSGVVSVVESGLTLTTGAVVSIVAVVAASPVFPCGSVAIALISCLPSAKGGSIVSPGTLQVPSGLTVAGYSTPSITSFTLDVGSSTVPVRSGVESVELVTGSIVTLGESVSRVRVPVPSPVLPAMSTALTVTGLSPLLS